MRHHSGAVVWSVVLHIAVAATLAIGFRLPAPQRAEVAMAPIQGVIIDTAALEKERQRRDQVAREERQRQERADRQKREAEVRQQREREAAEQRERDRLAEERQAKERAAKEEQERIAAEKREQERQAREREEAAKRERAQAEARRQQQQMESELQAALAAEEERRGLERAGLLDQYIRMIENQIERNWNAPPSAKTGLECVVNVVQIPSGDVVDVRVGRCNGDDAVVRSIEAAVRRASPLPKPPNPSLFERNLIVTFKPDL